MKHGFISAFSLFVALFAMSVAVSAQISRPYHDGSVWVVATIQMKPGMENAYKRYLTTDWKREQEALKKDGQILSYCVLETEGHGSNDWNMLLMTEYKDLATYEANQAKADNLAQTVVGDDAKQMQGYRERLAIREVLGTRVARQIILEPKR